MMTDFISIGFDLRTAAKLRGGGLVRPDQLLDRRHESAVSADSAVWLQPSELAQRYQSGVLDASINPLHLFSTLIALEDAYRKICSSNVECEFVAITVHRSVVSWLNQRFGPGYFEKTEEEIELLQAGWRHLGFDIVDIDGVISGLKGCGFAEPVLSNLRKHFSNCLNTNGLFTSSFDAAMFAQIRGLEIRDHSPFVVVGVLTREPISK